jgi:hypothetical protein
MKKIVFMLLVVFSVVYAQDDFTFIVDKLIKIELKKLPKPPKELTIVKDEFETTAEFNKRVLRTKKNQKEKIQTYKQRYATLQEEAKQRAIRKALQYTWGKPLIRNLRYDADNGYFLADIHFEMKKDFSKKIAIAVPREDAKSFKHNFRTLKPQAVFEYDGKSIALKDIAIPFKRQKYRAQFTDINLEDTKLAVNIVNNYAINNSLETNINLVDTQVSHLDASKFRNFHELDDMLKNIKASEKDSKKWLFVVGIEQYSYTDNIRFAKRSAEMFVKVAQKKLGVPKHNSYVMINAKATQADIKRNMKKMLRRVKKGDTIYFYYNGHGIPVPSLKNEPFMLASNTEPDFVADETFFSLKNIYAKLSNSKASKIVAIVDSCFSGVTDGVGVMKGVAATKMVAKKVSFNKEKMVVLSAGKAYQYSNGYNKKGHRLFSFFVMKNILKGDTSIKKLFKDTKSQTYNASLEEYGDSRTQEPSIDGNFRMKL